MVEIKNGGHVPYPETVEITDRWFVIRPSKIAIFFACFLWTAFLLAAFSPWICDLLRSWKFQLPAFLYWVKVPSSFKTADVIMVLFPAVLSFACYYVWISWIFGETKVVDGLERVIRFSKSSEVIEFSRVTSVLLFKDSRRNSDWWFVVLSYIVPKFWVEGEIDLEASVPFITRIQEDKAMKIKKLLDSILNHG